jgi:hypothetical protein
MEEHKFVYTSKFPIDPFKRDNIYIESSALSQELNASLIQRKQFNIGKVPLSAIKAEDHNILNVIKTDYKTQ